MLNPNVYGQIYSSHPELLPTPQAQAQAEKTVYRWNKAVKIYATKIHNSIPCGYDL